MNLDRVKPMNRKQRRRLASLVRKVKKTKGKDQGGAMARALIKTKKRMKNKRRPSSFIPVPHDPVRRASDIDMTLAFDESLEVVHAEGRLEELGDE